MKNGELEGVESLLIEALNISLKSGDPTNTFYKFINLGEYYLKVKDTAKSRDFLNKALVLGKKIKASNELKLVYDLLSKAEPQKDSYYKGKIIRLTDSLAVVQRKNRNKYARIEYETSVVEDANKELSNRNLYLIIGVVVLAGALGIRYVLGQRKELTYRKRLQEAELELFDLMRSSQMALHSVREEEQNRISMELHDNILNKIYGARLQLGMYNAVASPEAEEKRSKQIDNLQAIEQEIRGIAYNLRTDMVVSHFDYSDLLKSCVQQVNAIGETEYYFVCDPNIDWESISGLVKITIYRILQEALSNVVKYAEATECYISISQIDFHALLFSISDNGKGFDETQIAKGIGIKNMRDRACLVKADFSIKSVVGVSTTIQCQFPV
jgi:signal transduction histidine kinase